MGTACQCIFIDTGAAVSVTSLKTHESLPQEIRSPLQPTNFHMSYLTGNSLEIADLDKITCLHCHLTVHNVFILHIPVEAILAQDTLLAHEGKKDLCNSTLRLANTLLPNWAISEDAMTCKVVVSGKNGIPVWRMVSVSLAHKGYFREVRQTQPYHNAMTSQELLVIPSIVSTREPAVDVRMANFVNQGTICYSMAHIETHQLINMNGEPPGGKLKMHTTHGASRDMEKTQQLRDLIWSNSSQPIAGHKVEFTRLIRKYQANFAVAKKGLKRSDLVKQHINIESGPSPASH